MFDSMKQILAIALTAALATGPVLAQDTAPEPEAESEGFSLIEEGFNLILRGFMTEVEPALDEMGKALEEIRPAIEELGPKFRELITMIGDFSNYAAPEMLPNGDIIIRRTAPLPDAPPAEPAPAPDGGIDL